MPKVSVLMPTYNTDPQHLREAIESILSQTYTDFEFLILDDCSPNPEVREVIKSYKDSRIRYFENEENLGISNSRNKLLDLAEGEYLAVFDHDDVSMPLRLELQIEFLDNNPEVGVLGSAVEETPKGNILKYPSDNDDIEDYLMFKCAVVHSSSMLRKKVLTDNSICYENAYSPAEDYMLWVRLIGKTKFANIPEILLHYRVHAQNTTHRSWNRMQSASLAISAMAKRLYPNVKERMESKRIIKISYRFMGIKILTIHKKAWRTKFLLFGRFTVLKTRVHYQID